MMNHSTFFLRALPTLLLLASSAWADEFVPDPAKQYIIENMKYGTTLAANGKDKHSGKKPYQGGVGENSEDTRWVFTKTNKTDDEDRATYFVDRAAGGTYSRLHLGGRENAKMKKADNNKRKKVRFSFVGSSSDGKFHLDSGADDPYKRLRFRNDGKKVAAFSTDATGTHAKFTIREAEDIDPAETIINNKPWDDTDGNVIDAGKGGQITEIDGVWYWIGSHPNHQENGYDLHLYSSATLGDGTWEFLGVVVDNLPKEGFASNCKLVRHPEGYYVIVGKGNVFYNSTVIDGQYDKFPATNIGNYNQRSTWNEDGDVMPGPYRFKYGGGSLFIDPTDNTGATAYFITSRLNKECDDKDRPKCCLCDIGIVKNDRNVGIYRLTQDWLDYEEEVYWAPNIGREAMFLFWRNGMYYMTASKTDGWGPSDTYYRTATQLSGPWSEEKLLKFAPAETVTGESVESHGCQQRYLVDLGGDRWMFGGDRYPVENATIWDEEDGRHLRIPVVWDGDEPTVYWRMEWNVGTFDFENNKAEEEHSPIPGVPGS